MTALRQVRTAARPMERRPTPTTGGLRSACTPGHQVGSAVKHVSSHRVEDEVQTRLGGRVVVGTDGGAELFLYTHAQDAALAAQQSVSELLASHGLDADYTVERWHPIAEEWEAADVPLPSSPAQVQAEHKQ